MSNCRSGCPTPGQHASWGECARAANLQIGSVLHDVHVAGDKELNAYAAARREGLQPNGTTWKHINAAKAAADHFGQAT